MELMVQTFFVVSFQILKMIIILIHIFFIPKKNSYICHMLVFLMNLVLKFSCIKMVFGVRSSRRCDANF